MLQWICPECGRECEPGEPECIACYPAAAAAVPVPAEAAAPVAPDRPLEPDSLLALAESIGINEPASDLIDASDIPILLPGIALVVESGGGDEFDAGGMEQSATSPDPGIALVAPGGAEPCAEIAAPPAIACEALIESDEDQVVSIDLLGKETPDELAPAEPVSDLPGDDAPAVEVSRVWPETIPGSSVEQETTTEPEPHTETADAGSIAESISQTFATAAASEPSVGSDDASREQPGPAAMTCYERSLSCVPQFVPAVRLASGEAVTGPVIEVDAVPVECAELIPLQAAPPMGGVLFESVFEGVRRVTLLPGWLASLLFAVILLIAAVCVLFYVLPGTRTAAANENAVLAESVAAPLAANWVSRTLTKYVEVTGMRLTAGADGRASVQFIVVNHSGAEIVDATVHVTVRSDAQDSPLFTFAFALPALGPYESRDMGTEIDAPLRLLDTPAWQNLRADVQVTSP